MSLIEFSSAIPVEMFPGVVRRTMTAGDRMMLVEVRIDAGATVPAHTHPHEQTGYLVSGRARFRIAAEESEIQAGDCWMVPGGVEHEVTALEASIVIDVFSPPREEYR